MTDRPDDHGEPLSGTAPFAPGDVPAHEEDLLEPLPPAAEAPTWPPLTPASETREPRETGETSEAHDAGEATTDPRATWHAATWPARPGWTPPPPPGRHGAAGWPPPERPRPSAGRRVLTAVAVIALALASGGIGAAIETAVHGSSSSGAAQPFPIRPFQPDFGNGDGSGASPSSGTLDAEAIAAKVTPAIVNINTTLAPTGRAAGTGMIISSSGEVLTNNHVISDATSVRVTIGVTGESHTAHVVGYDVKDDVALLQMDGASHEKTVTFGDASKVQVGDPVVAIGNAGGRGGTPTVTQGSVTALDQQVTAGDLGGETETLQGMLQINAPIQPGDSGGPLVDKNGHVIGMNTAAAGGRFQQQTGSNIGFAITIDKAVSVARVIANHQDTETVHIGPRGLLGVQVRNASQGDAFGNAAPVDSGALVINVQNGSGADAAGIRTGDVIVSVAGESVADTSGLHLALAKYHPGDHVDIGWVDGSGARHSANVTLTEGPPA